MADEPTPVTADRRSWSRPMLVAVGVAAIGVGVFVVTGAGDGSPGATGGSNTAATGGGAVAGGAFDALTVREGDVVTGEGVIVDGPGSPLLCQPNPVPAVAWPEGEGPPPSCSPLAVSITGLEHLTLPAWVERDGVWFTEAQVVVQGVWHEGAVAVSEVTGAEAGSAPEADLWWQVPCAPPAGGWALYEGLPPGMPPDQQEAAFGALATAMDAHPERYHARWVGYPDGDPADAPTNDMGEPQFDHVVMIVSTVDDAAEVQAELAAVYPGNLCVTHVDHSAAELEAVVNRLTGTVGWVADAYSLASSADNRVVLELPVLDEAAVAQIGDDANLVEVAPLIRRVDG